MPATFNGPWILGNQEGRNYKKQLRHKRVQALVLGEKSNKYLKGIAPGIVKPFEELHKIGIKISNKN